MMYIGYSSSLNLQNCKISVKCCHCRPYCYCAEVYSGVWIVTPLIINTSTQQAPYTGDRARCAASTAPNTRGGTRESTAACGRRPGPPRSCRCSRSGDRHCATGSRGTNRPRVRPAAPPQPPLGCAAFCTGSCTRDRASSGAANRCPGSGDPPSALAGGSR